MGKQQQKDTESTTTALATAGGPAELAVLDGLDLASDGLDEVGNEDFKIALKIWNMKGTDAAGDPIPANVFFDTVEESVKKQLRLVFLTLHKSKAWQAFDETSKKMKTYCRSNDRVMGIMENGTERPCANCPDAQWRSVEGGKRKRNCSDVYSAVALDLDTNQPCTLRFKKTSLPVIQSHLQKHHIGKRISQGKRENVPFFYYQVNASLKMVGDTTKYAVPVLERGEAITDPARLQQLASEAQFFREHILPIMEKLAEKDTGEDVDAAGPAGDDASFEFGANAGGGAGGRRFADSDLR